jgi:hypothetical protein
VKSPPFSGDNCGNQSRKLSIKELHSIRIGGLLDDEVVKSLFPPRNVDVLRKARILKR